MKDIVKILILLTFLIVSKLTLGQCDSYGTISVSTSGFENGSGYIQEYALVDNVSGLIISINTTGNFTNVSPGEYLVYAANYQGTAPSELYVGQPWSGVIAYDANSSNCFDASGAYGGGVVVVCEQVCSDDPFTLSSTGFYAGGSSSQNYVIVPAPGTGNILASKTSGTFTNTDYGSDGVYVGFAINTEVASVVSAIAAGNSWPSALATINTNCADYIGPYYVEVGTATCPLALSEIELSGAAYHSYNKLTWVAKMYQEVKYYEIQRSETGSNYQKIGESNNDIYEDHDAPKTSFYRLKIVFESGEVKYSNRIKIDRNNKFSIISLYPNPTTGQVHLNVSVEKGKTEIIIQNAIGQLVKNYSYDLEDGINDIQVDISVLPEGIYYFSVRNGEQIIQEKVIKL